MCFFKHLKPIPDIDTVFDKEVAEQSCDVSNPQKQEIKTPKIDTHLSPFLHGAYLGSLNDLISRIKANNLMIGAIQQKINQEEFNSVPDAGEAMEDVPMRVSKDQILNKLFGDLPFTFAETNFKYKLSIDSNLPSKFYKHRKYAITVKLMPCTARSARVVLNTNPLNVCVGIFDKDGNWVHENVLGEPILEGLTQVSLYQGKAEFPRLLFNEISSNFPKEKLNLAIYVKPGLEYTGKGMINGSSNNLVNWKSVKPLILKNMTVLSKKRKKISEDLS